MDLAGRCSKNRVDSLESYYQHTRRPGRFDLNIESISFKKLFQHLTGSVKTPCYYPIQLNFHFASALSDAFGKASDIRRTNLKK